MSEGERVVFRKVENPEYVEPGDLYSNGTALCVNDMGRWRPNTSRTIYRRIPDPVPDLEARIAELEGELKRREDRIEHLHREHSKREQERNAVRRTPTPAAAKET